MATFQESQGPDVTVSILITPKAACLCQKNRLPSTSLKLEIVHVGGLSNTDYRHQGINIWR